MTAQMHDGEDGADEDERDEDVKMAISLLIIFLKFGVGKSTRTFPARLSYIRPITRMQQCAQTKDPENA